MDAKKQKQKCDKCGDWFVNLGAHQRFCGNNRLETITVDKPLDSLVSDIRQLLTRYQNQLTITTVEQSGSIEEVEIKARIRMRR